MLDYSYDVVKVTTLDFGTEYMVTRTDQFEKATHVSPQGLFKTEQEAKDFLNTLTCVKES